MNIEVEIYFTFPMKDKATVEMECMEEGYLAKIVRKEGEKEIKVGEVLILPGSPHSSFSLLWNGLFIWLFHNLNLQESFFSWHTKLSYESIHVGNIKKFFDR